MGRAVQGEPSFATVDLGASSGRVMLARWASGGLKLREVHRFANRPARVAGTLYWDVLALWTEILDGLRAAAREAGALVSVGVDSWAVDYGLLDARGRLLANPVHYRDGRTDGIIDAVAHTVRLDELYAATGVYPMPFNTIFQWVADRDGAAMRAAEHALQIPDLISYWLTGEMGCELTNASTTGLLDIGTQQWSDELCARLDLRRELLGRIRRPGEPAGVLRADVAGICGLDAVPVTVVGSHDTASAVAGIPALGENFAYISCGTWSLVGLELDAPVTSAAAFAAGFSNELGVDGTVRFLRNVMGLWLLQESVRTWQQAGARADLEPLLAEAAALPSGGPVIDPRREEFFPPGDMPRRIRAECRRSGQPPPESPAQMVRCILDSLASVYRDTITAAAELTGRTVDVIHLVGGGARNDLLCQLTADACELPVIVGPVEAAAYGNALIQARAAGVISGKLRDLRTEIGRDVTARYKPRERT